MSTAEFSRFAGIMMMHKIAISSNVRAQRKNPVTEGCLLCDYTYIKHPENASMELGFSDQRVTVYGCKVSLQGDGNVLYLD